MRRQGFSRYIQLIDLKGFFKLLKTGMQAAISVSARAD
jgi:hypothetical protein